MKLRHLYPLVTTLALAAAGLCIGSSVQAASYNFSQGGFADGARITGHFSGEDLDGDGYLYGYELSDFELFFSGNRAVGAFHHGMANLNGIVYALGEYRFDGGSDTVEHMASSNHEEAPYTEYDAFGWPGYNLPGRVSDNLNNTISYTWEPLLVTPAVPEPASGALLLAGLTTVGLLLRRKH